MATNRRATAVKIALGIRSSPWKISFSSNGLKNNDSTGLPSSRLQLHNDVTAVEHPENGQPETDEGETPQQRGKLVGQVRGEEEIEAGLMEGDLLAADGYLKQRIDAARHDAGADEGDQRVEAVDDERFGPSPHLVYVENPETRSQGHAGETGAEDDVARRPEILVDRKDPAPQLAGDHPQTSGAEEAGDPFEQRSLFIRQPAAGDDPQHGRGDGRQRR